MEIILQKRFIYLLKNNFIYLLPCKTILQPFIRLYNQSLGALAAIGFTINLGILPYLYNNLTFISV
jgi:hypothetical protein